MYILIVFLSLFSSIIVFLYGHKLGKTGSTIIIMITMILLLLLSLLLFFEVCLSMVITKLFLLKWISILGIFNIEFNFFFDTITVSMIFIIILISFFVHLYSIEYMSLDVGYPRFMAYLSLFTFFMLFLVSSNNYVQMFIGWEGVGLSSYLLISFWYTRILANKAAIKAMLVNRIGDLCLLISLSIIYTVFGSFNYFIIFSLVKYVANDNYLFFFNLNVISLICFFLFLGAMGKSAQIGLHVWLPDAMEGPTPVSALIHAATMVTAGVFLVIRSSFLFEYTQNILTIVVLIGGLTAFFSSIIGSFQFDIKKVVAYSTCSQLGYMFFSCGMSNYSISLFHLFNHAFFKALLFLSMGSIIHALSDEQDIRRMGGLFKLMPLTYISVIIGSMALMGVPFLTGFYSKDLILETTFSAFKINGIYIYILGILSAMLTCFYSIRLIYWIFLSESNSYKNMLYLIHEPKWKMSITLVILSIFSIFSGYLFSDVFFILYPNHFINSININVDNLYVFESEFYLGFLKYIPLIFTLFGIFVFIVYMYTYDIYFFNKNKKIVNYFYIFFNKAMFFDYLYNNVMFFSFKYYYININKYLEKGLFEYYTTNIIRIIFDLIYYYLGSFNSGLIYHYIYIIILFMLIYIFFFTVIVYINIVCLSLLIFIYFFYVTSR